MGGGSRIAATSWSDLPKDLLEKISKCLDTETDARRFRAVCNSWRSSTPPVKKSPLTHLKLPFPFYARYFNPDAVYMNLTERTVYRVQSPNCRDPNFWLVKIVTSEDGKSRILNPVSDHKIKLLPETKMPKVLNTLDFRVSEVRKSYTLHYVNPSKPKWKYGLKVAKKVAVSVGANNDEEYVITAIDYTNELWYIKSGHQKWTKVCHNPFGCYLDIVNYKGEFYGVEACGNVWLFASMFEGPSVFINNSEDHGASNRHLVELFDGELVLVDLVTDKEGGECTCLHDIDDDVDVECPCYISRTPVMSTSEKIMISRMDKSRGEWVKANTEINGIIFLGADCSFSFSAQELEKGCKGIRAFYSDPYICFRTDGEKKLHLPNDFKCYCCDPPEGIGMVDNLIPSDDVKLKFRGLHGHNTGVCDFETGKLGSVLKFPEYAEIFWPPPSWLNRS